MLNLPLPKKGTDCSKTLRRTRPAGRKSRLLKQVLGARIIAWLGQDYKLHPEAVHSLVAE